MLRELAILQAPPAKRPREVAKTERRRQARAEVVEASRPSLPLVIGIGTKSSRPLRLAILALVEVVGAEALCAEGQADELQSQALASTGATPEVVWRIGRQWPMP